eukprot:1128398-Pyramimonas_sp.AAC.1
MLVVCLGLRLAEFAAELLDPSPVACALELGLVEVDFLLASELEPERGRVDDDRARVSPALGEGLG